MASFYVGVAMTLKVTFTDTAGALFDPATAKLTVLSPTGVVSTPVVVHDGLGKFSSSYTPQVSGLHQYLFVGLDGGANPIAAAKSSFQSQALSLS